MPTPYITPDVLIAAPTGIAWTTVPWPKATPAEQLAEQMNICRRVTAEINANCNQVLRATIDTEEVDGPDYTITVSRRGARMLLTRWPVLSLISAQYSGANVFPRQYQAIPQNMMALEYSSPGVLGTAAPDDAGVGPNALIVAPGYLNWAYGRNGWRLQATYVNGWPHAGLTATTGLPTSTTATTLVDTAAAWTPAAFVGMAVVVGASYGVITANSATSVTVAAWTGGTPAAGVTRYAIGAGPGATVIPVDDCTGWAGITGTIYDGAETEDAHAVSASVQAGPGALTLSTPLAHAHPPARMISALPGNVQQAAIYFAMAQALVRGTTAVAVPALPGSASKAGGPEVDALKAAGRELLEPLRRSVS